MIICCQTYLKFELSEKHTQNLKKKNLPNGFHKLADLLSIQPRLSIMSQGKTPGKDPPRWLTEV